MSDVAAPGSSDLADIVPEAVHSRTWRAAVSEREDRARLRYRRAALTSVATLAARAAGFVSTAISVPLVVHHAGAETTGVWLTLASFVALLGFADLGLGNGLVNSASRAAGADDRRALVSAISSTFFLLTAAALLLAVAMAIAYPFVPWGKVVNAHSAGVRRQVGPAVAGLIILFVAAMPLKVVDRTQTALQRGFVPSLWQAAGTLVGLGGLGAAVVVGAGLRWLVWAPLLGLFVASLANWRAFFTRHRDLRPRFEFVSRAECRRLLGLGAGFLVLQLAVSVCYGTDSVVIAQTRGAAAVQQYAVPMQLFIFPARMISLALMPLWPAYSEARASGDHAWTTKTLRRTVLAAAGIGAGGAITLAVLAPWILRLWVGGAVHPSALLLCALGAWLFAMALTDPISVYLNGNNIVGRQALGAVVMMVVNLGLSIYLAKTIGVSGVVWGTVIAQAFFLAPGVFLIRRARAKPGKRSG